MLIDTIFFAVGLALIIKGGEWFVSSSVRIAEFLNLPRIVIGTTLMSLATTSPELVVAIMSGLRGESGLAVGNAVGSCLCNMGLILGVMAVIRQIDVHPKELIGPIVALFAFGFLLLILTWNLQLSKPHGLLLILLGVGYFCYDFVSQRRSTDPEDIAEARSIENAAVAGHPMLRTRAGAAASFAAGAILVVFGSRLLVNSAVDIAQAVGIPSMVIGLSVVAVGTSLPELVTAITSTRQNVSDLAMGNILGANIANLTLIVGTAASLNDVVMTRSTQALNFPALLIGMCLMLMVIVSDQRVTRREGYGMLAFYGAYIAVLLTLTVAGK